MIVRLFLNSGNAPDDASRQRIDALHAGPLLVGSVAPVTAMHKSAESHGTEGVDNSFRTRHRWPQRRLAMPDTAGMKDHVYKILDLVGSSEKSIEDAIQNAITRASKTIREMKWFEVVQTRGHIENGSVRHYQVTLRVGFTLEE
jgi:flavin-binding protein dodecin